MTEKKKQQQRSEPKAFRAHVWSPLNKGEAILEIPEGTTVEQLLGTLAGIWGAKFKPDAGFTGDRRLIAGWCLLCRTKGGVFVPLGIEDTIPTTPAADSREEYGSYPGSWFNQTWHRVRYGREKRSRGTVAQEIMLEIYKSLTQMDGRRRAPKLKPGIMFTGPEGAPTYDEDFAVLASGPEPKEPVDVRLALIIAVSGT